MPRPAWYYFRDMWEMIYVSENPIHTSYVSRSVGVPITHTTPTPNIQFTALLTPDKKIKIKNRKRIRRNFVLSSLLETLIFVLFCFGCDCVCVWLDILTCRSFRILVITQSAQSGAFWEAVSGSFFFSSANPSSLPDQKRSWGGKVRCMNNTDARLLLRRGNGSVRKEYQKIPGPSPPTPQKKRRVPFPGSLLEPYFFFWYVCLSRRRAPCMHGYMWVWVCVCVCAWLSETLYYCRSVDHMGAFLGEERKWFCGGGWGGFYFVCKFLVKLAHPPSPLPNPNSRGGSVYDYIQRSVILFLCFWAGGG